MVLIGPSCVLGMISGSLKGLKWEELVKTDRCRLPHVSSSWKENVSHTELLSPLPVMFILYCPCEMDCICEFSCRSMPHTMSASYFPIFVLYHLSNSPYLYIWDWLPVICVAFLLLVLFRIISSRRRLLTSYFHHEDNFTGNEDKDKYS